MVKINIGKKESKQFDVSHKIGIHSSHFDEMMKELRDSLDERTYYIVSEIIHKHTTSYL